MPIVSLIIFFAIIFALWFEFSGRKWGIPAIPTLPWQRRVLVKTLVKHQAQTIAPLHIIELGCGWGGVMAAIHRAFPLAHITGVDVYPPALFVARLRFLFNKSIRVQKADIFTLNLSSYDVVVCYLSHDHMRKLQPKFDAELKPGVLVISNAFPLPDWIPTDHIVTHAGVPLHVYVYKKS